MTKVTDPRGTSAQTTYTTQYAWDTMRRLTQKTDANGKLTNYTYDVDGELTQTNLQLGAGWQTTSYTYTPTGQQATITDPQSHVTTKSYDVLDRLSYVTDAEGRKTKTVYDAAGQVVKQIRAWQGVNDNCAVSGTLQQCYAQYSYDNNGNKLTVQDANGNTTAYAYNGYDRLAQATFPDATSEQYTYDNNGNTLTKLTRAGQTIANAYDAMNRLTSKTVPSAPTVTYGYDLASRQTGVAQTAAGNQPAYSVANTYDNAGRLTAVNDNGRNVSYQYDAAGNRLRVTWPDAYYVTYAYDPLNKVTAILQNGTTTLASYTRDDLTRRTAATYGNGTSTSYAYEIDNDLSTLGQTFVGSSVSFGFTSNTVHQVTARSVSDTNYEWLPPYNDNTAYTPNNLNQYSGVTKNGLYGGYVYDANGNMTSDGQNSYAYDAENKLVTATTVTPGVHSVIYQYDPLGRRFAKSVDGTVTQYLSDQSEEIGEYTSAGVLLRRYVYGPGVDEPVVRIEYNSGGSETARYYHHMDAQGSVIADTTGTGAIADRYVYDPYGNSADGLTGNQIRYTGRRFDPETGLYYYRARYYSPTLGRFLQTDPIGYNDNVNLYEYANDDPLKYRDPTGMDADGALIGAAWGAEAGEVIGGALGLFFLPSEAATLPGGAAVGAAVGAVIGDALTGPTVLQNQNAQPPQNPQPQNDRSSRGERLKPDPNAEGPHSTFKRDHNGNITKTATYDVNPKNPSGFDEVKRTDVTGKDAHFNKVTNERVPTPHTHGKDIPGGVRPATPHEIPKLCEPNLTGSC